MQIIYAVGVERRRLSIPAACPPPLAHLLKECWRHNAPLRPSFPEVVQRLRALEGSALKTFEAHLWAACAEAQGKTPRPGSSAWSRAQDRWREALLREALLTESTAAQLARTVERLYEQVGCPEDMLLMLRPSQAWSNTPATVDPAAVQRFLDQSQERSRRYGTAS